MARRWIESSTDKRTTLLSASSASAGSLLRDRGFFSCLVLIASIRTFKHWYKRKENKRKQKKQSKTAEGSGGLTHGCVVGVGEALVHPLPHELPFVVRKVALDDLVVVLPQLFGGLRGGVKTPRNNGLQSDRLRLPRHKCQRCCGQLRPLTCFFRNWWFRVGALN